MLTAVIPEQAQISWAEISRSPWSEGVADSVFTHLSVSTDDLTLALLVIYTSTQILLATVNEVNGRKVGDTETELHVGESHVALTPVLE